MKARILLLLLVLMGSFIACNDDDVIQMDNDPEEEENTSTIPVDLLLNCWVFTYEDYTQDGPWIYRPCEDIDEIGWDRYVFTVYEDGICEYLVSYPNDGQEFVEGTWILNSNDVFTIVSLDGIIITEYKILQLEEDFLKVEL